MKQPCYGCEMRAVGCHGSCTLYNEWKEDHINQLRLEAKERHKDCIQRNFKKEMIIKEKRSHGRKS